jgi:hypothetical protein
VNQPKTGVAYSEPKQDAELPSKITDLENTQPCGLCHNNKSELGLLLRQPVQYEEEIIQSSPAVNAISQQALHSIQYAMPMTNKVSHLPVYSSQDSMDLLSVPKSS